MDFILVDDAICIATHFTIDRELETQDVSTGSNTQSTQVTVGQKITGEMLLFRRGELPAMLRQSGGAPKKMRIEYADSYKWYILDDVMPTFRRTVTNGYEKCEAAYVEYIASDIEVSKLISQSISVDTTL